MRSNGLDVISMNVRKPTLTSAMMPSTRATMRSGRCLLNAATAVDQKPSIRVHSSNEPSWPPQTPANR